MQKRILFYLIIKGCFIILRLIRIKIIYNLIFSLTKSEFRDLKNLFSTKSSTFFSNNSATFFRTQFAFYFNVPTNDSSLYLLDHLQLFEPSENIQHTYDSKTHFSLSQHTSQLIKYIVLHQLLLLLLLMH